MGKRLILHLAVEILAEIVRCLPSYTLKPDPILKENIGYVVAHSPLDTVCLRQEHVKQELKLLHMYIIIA